MYKYVLFDLDGTLTDSAEGITKSVQFALMQQGIMETDLTKLERFIGPPLTDSFVKYYGLDMEHTEKAVRDFRKRYEPVGIFENRTYDGIPQMLSSLKDAGVKLLVASSKPEIFVYKVLEQFKIKQYFDVIAGADSSEKNGSKETVMQRALWMLVDLLDGKKVSVSKAMENPQQDGRSREDLEDAMDRHGISKTSCAMVGDTKYDINAAKEFGLSAVGVEYGFASEGELESAGADIIAENPDELLTVLIGSSGVSVKKN